MEILNSPYFDFLVLPLFIFFLRICDVTLDTMRIIFMTKGFKRLAPIIGFFEVLNLDRGHNPHHAESEQLGMLCGICRWLCHRQLRWHVAR